MLFVSKVRRAVPVLAAVLALAACEGNSTGSGNHPDLAAVQISANEQTVTVTSTGVQTGSLTVGVGDTPVTVQWVNSAGAVFTPTAERVLTMQIIPVGTGTGVSFVPSGISGGRLNATSTGQKTVSVRFLHGDHTDFLQNVTFTVQ